VGAVGSWKALTAATLHRPFHAGRKPRRRRVHLVRPRARFQAVLCGLAGLGNASDEGLATISLAGTRDTTDVRTHGRRDAAVAETSLKITGRP
jgi:hypothetical protein